MNFFRRKVRRGTTLTISDQTKQSKGSLSSGDGRASSVGSTSTLRKSTAEDDRISASADVKENGSFHGSIKHTRGIKQTRFSDDTNANNNSTVVPDASPLNHTNGTYLSTEHPQSGQAMALLSQHGPSLVQDLPLENTSSGTPMALYASVIKGDKAELKKIITGNLELLDTADNFGRTPLMYCVLADRLDCAKYLINMGCKLDQVDNAGRSATHSAAHKGSYKFIELLHNRGASLDIKDNDGQTPLHLATRIRTPKCVEFVLRNLGPGMVDIPDNQMRTALHWSAAFNNTECVKLLIKYGINIALTDAECKTPLHWAANNHDPSTVNTMRALLEKSPSVLNWQDNEGRTALHYAVAHGNSAAVEFLVNFSAEEFSELFECDSDRSDYTYRTPMHWAAQLGHTHIVKLLLQGNANISSSDGNGATPFLYAALTDKDAVVEAMIEHDPKVVEQADIEGRTALMWAAGKGSNNVMRILLGIKKPPPAEEENGEASTRIERETKPRLNFTAVDVDKHDNKGNTAVHVAARNGHGSSVELLLKHGARHDIQNTDMHHTPIFGACEKGHLNCVTYLLDYKASINIVDSENRTPLHWAALGGHAEVCELLIKEGLDVDVRDKLERTPLHCAAFGGFINCMNLLLEHGANVDLQDQEGRSALHWAAQSGHLDAIKLLFQYSVFPNPMEYTEERLTPLDHALQKEKEDVMHYLIEQGALSAEHIRNIAAMRIQAYFRGFKVRRQREILMKTLLLRKEKRKKIEAEMEEKSAEQVRNAAASKIQTSYRKYLVRKNLTEDKTDEWDDTERDNNEGGNQLEDVKRIEDALDTKANEKSDLTANNDSGSHSPEQELLPDNASSSTSVANADKADVSHDEGVICDHVSMASSHSSLPNDTKTIENSADKTDENRQEDKQIKTDDDSSDESEQENEDLQPPEESDHTLTEVTDDRAPITKPTASYNKLQKTKRYVSRKTRSKATTRPVAVDSDSSKDRAARKRNSSISSSSSLLSTTSAASTIQKQPRKIVTATSANYKNDRKYKPKPPSQPKDVKPRRKRLMQAKETKSEFLSPELDKIGNEENIGAQDVKGIAYKPQQQDPVYISDELNLVPECPVKTSSNLDLSEYIENLMALSPSERKMLNEHQNRRREAFRVANQAASTIQRSWLKYVKEHHPALHRKFVAARKKELKRRRPIKFEKRGDSNTAHQDSETSAEKVPPLHQFHDPNMSKLEASDVHSKATVTPSIASSSAASMVRSPRSEATRSSLISSSEIGSVGSRRKSSKSRRSSSRSQNNVYISLERLEELSRIYGNPKLVRDLLANSGRSNSSLPSITSSKSTSNMKRPGTVPDTPRQAFESSLKGTSAYSQPKSAIHSPRVWTALPGVQKQTRLTAPPASQSHARSKSVPANRSIDYRLMPLQWQKLYGELQDATATESKRKNAARFSYNLGEMS